MKLYLSPILTLFQPFVFTLKRKALKTLFERTRYSVTPAIRRTSPETSRKETPPSYQLRRRPACRRCRVKPEKESVCDDERGGAVTKRVVAAGGASLFAVAEKGKEELLPSCQLPSFFLVANERAARTVAVAEEGDAREGAVSVVTVAAVDKMSTQEKSLTLGGNEQQHVDADADTAASCRRTISLQLKSFY
ncbi:hypothetical protein HN51_051633 [Arachis hypogaea]